jgi:hypothetical protein
MNEWTAKQLIDGFVNPDEVKATLYLRVFARIFYVFYKSGKGDIHERLLGEGERRENRRIGSHTFLRGVHEFLSELTTFIFRPGWNSVWDIFTHCCRSLVSLVKTADVKALNFWHRCCFWMLRSVDWQLQDNRLVPSSRSEQSKYNWSEKTILGLLDLICDQLFFPELPIYAV